VNDSKHSKINVDIDFFPVKCGPFKNILYLNVLSKFTGSDVVFEFKEYSHMLETTG